MTTDLAPRDNVVEMARPAGGGLALSFQEMLQRVALVDQFYREVMQDGTDYGKIPGTDKPTLYQPGAQMLDQIFGYAPVFEVMPSSVIDWDRQIAFFDYDIRCRLVSRKTGETVAEGIGSCNSFEDKYRWRQAKRTCPDCGAAAILKGKAEYGGGWICFKKQGGCGAKFSDGSPEIEGQVTGRVENDDSASLKNTISKMAQKRAHVAATLNATGASRIFTQDIEDLPQFQNALVVESKVATSPPDQPVTRPAAPDFRAKFDPIWRKRIERANACGVVRETTLPLHFSAEQLRAAQSEIEEQIKARETLNAALLERIQLFRDQGGVMADVDPSKVTDEEIHKGIADLDEALLPVDDESAPF